MKLLLAAIGATALVVAACTHKMHQAAPREGPWKLVFQDPTLLTDPDQFEQVLNGYTSRWEWRMKVKKRKGHPPHQRPDHTNGKPEPVVTETKTYPSHDQPKNQDRLHVTQKVVLQSKADLEAVVALIEYPNTSGK